MLIRITVAALIALPVGSANLWQSNRTAAQTTRRRTTTTKTTTATQSQRTGQTQNTNRPVNSNNSGAATEQDAADAESAPRAERHAEANPGVAAASAQDPTSRGVLAAFEALLNGIRQADVDLVASVYWRSPDLTLFNYNGTVTRSWEQMRRNRASSYPSLQEVQLDVRDVRVQMLGREGAVLTCQWTQSQLFRGTPENASGRMTLVFRRVGGAWKVSHLHTSPDTPDPSRIPPSEQSEDAVPAQPPARSNSAPSAVPRAIRSAPRTAP